MDVDAAFRVPVLDGAPGVPVRLQPGPGGLLELLEHFPDLPLRRVVSGAQAITPVVLWCANSRESATAWTSDGSPIRTSTLSAPGPRSPSLRSGTPPFLLPPRRS